MQSPAALHMCESLNNSFIATFELICFLSDNFSFVSKFIKVFKVNLLNLNFFVVVLRPNYFRAFKYLGFKVVVLLILLRRSHERKFVVLQILLVSTYELYL